MSACVTTTNLSSRGEYPALDPRRTAGSRPGYDRRFGYPLAADGITVILKRNPTSLRLRDEGEFERPLPSPRTSWHGISGRPTWSIKSAAQGLSFHRR